MTTTSASKRFSSISNYLSQEERRAVAKQFKLYRKSSGYSQYTFAEWMGVSRQSVNDWEHGYNLTSLVTACEIHRKTKGACRVEMMRPDLIKFLREFKDVIDDLKI